MKVSELEGSELDYWVANAGGWHHRDDVTRYHTLEKATHLHLEPYEPSTDWSQGGPIIERFDVTLESHWLETPLEKAWQARTPSYLYPEWAVGKGKTPLIAAMRAFVCSVFGEEVPDGPLEDLTRQAQELDMGY